MRRMQEAKLGGVVVGSVVTMELYSTNNKVVYFIPPLFDSYFLCQLPKGSNDCVHRGAFFSGALSLRTPMATRVPEKKRLLDRTAG